MKYINKLITEKPGISWLFIVGVIFLIYSKSITYPILYNFDDDAYITDTRITELNIEHTKEYFSDYYLGMYQPIPVLSFAVANSLFPDSIPAQRLINILLHCFNALLVLLVVRKLSSNVWIAWLSALIFAIHPMHVESVSWLSTRSNLLYALFYLLAILFYIKYLTSIHRKFILLTFLFFVLSLFSKVTAATLPFILVLIHWYINGHFSVKNIVVFISQVLLSAVFVFIGIKASGSFGHIAELGMEYNYIERGFILLNALWVYLVKSLLPINLSAIYLFPIYNSGSIPTSYYMIGSITLIIISGLIAYGIYRIKSHNDKSFLFGILFFLLTISIVLPIKWSRTVLVAERYTYISYIGLILAILLFLFQYTHFKKQIFKKILILVMGLYLVVLGFQSYMRNKVWETPLTLFTDVINKNRGPAEVSMGYFNRGNEYLRLQLIENAENDYSSAILKNPAYAEAYFNRGLIYFNQSKFQEAITDFSQTIHNKPNQLDAYVNRGVAFRAMGEYSKSLNDFNYVIDIKPDGKAFFNRGVLYYLNLGDSLQACSDWQKAREKGIKQADELLQMYCK